MKRLIFIPLFFLIITVSYGQSQSGFGLIGGLNYNGNGNYFQSIESSAQHPDKNAGFHLGVFGKLGNRVYFKPSLVFTSTKSGYEDGDFKMQKLDLPAVVGIKVIGPLSAFAGPSFQYILDSDFDGISINNIENDFSVGFNFGIGLNIKKIGIDLKYERGFSKNEATFIGNNLGENTVSRLDTRPEQLILSLSLLL
ncbi:outer membrane beta-barrel protein [Yeosuana sp. MJ-SS3]|uniref:Outer membrane beta-barrel protein n=1 Tax=Gilvirhabdus luticola TaxID=3079858 RepID=A0ABU3U6T6_9FLAO|nr:outer membrane beta-barrel protein [Yeosuana sp. MJ-SS3]MDU8886123.1 outer membrane beta-barrel protein [Yeosuana sp. MJ-SS3]